MQAKGAKNVPDGRTKVKDKMQVVMVDIGVNCARQRRLTMQERRKTSDRQRR